jgi:phosphoribosylglycinamide formyltransferase 1
MPDPKKLRPRFVILISGQGSNMQAIVQACQSGDCAAEVAAVIASRAETAGLAWAAQSPD